MLFDKSQKIGQKTTKEEIDESYKKLWFLEYSLRRNNLQTDGISRNLKIQKLYKVYKKKSQNFVKER